jgi:hypothetical protein
MLVEERIQVKDLLQREILEMFPFSNNFQHFQPELPEPNSADMRMAEGGE